MRVGAISDNEYEMTRWFHVDCMSFNRAKPKIDESNYKEVLDGFGLNDKFGAVVLAAVMAGGPSLRRRKRAATGTQMRARGYLSGKSMPR